jgi:hypothetical protein
MFHNPFFWKKSCRLWDVEKCGRVRNATTDDIIWRNTRCMMDKQGYTHRVAIAHGGDKAINKIRTLAVLSTCFQKFRWLNSEQMERGVGGGGLYRIKRNEKTSDKMWVEFVQRNHLTGWENNTKMDLKKMHSEVNIRTERDRSLPFARRDELSPWSLKVQWTAVTPEVACRTRRVPQASPNNQQLFGHISLTD